MEVILLERIEKIGKLGDVVKVKDGFARNYLLPQKKALRANKENVEIYQKQKKLYEEKNAALLKEAQSIAKNMTNVSISIIKQASESGQLYGSVAAREISDTIKLKGHNIQTKQIQLSGVIKNIGVHEVKVALHPELILSVIVKVLRSDEELILDTTEEKNIEDNTKDELIKTKEELKTVVEDNKSESNEDSVKKNTKQAKINQGKDIKEESKKANKDTKTKKNNSKQKKE
tara:strand:- start:220 stop:912 length:693 start_codon:yes stop_codon:yes gene_type:complete